MKICLHKLYWLAGIIDAEGCIGLYKYTPTKRYKKVVRPMITIVNTNVDLMNEVLSIINSIGINCGMIKRKNSKQVNRKDCYRIVLQDKDKCQFLLDEIRDYLIAKKEQANIVLEFCKRERFDKQTEKEKILCHKIMSLNRKGK